MDQNDAKLNLGESSSDSQATKDNGTATTQVDEKSTATKDSSSDIPFHEHPRFKELVDEKNQYKMQLELFRKEVDDLKKQNQGNMEASKNQSAFDLAVDRLVKKGMDHSTATEFVKDQVELMQTVVQQNVAPLYQSQGQLTLSQTLDSFRQKYPDYDKYKTKMSEILASMPKSDQDWIMSNLSRGLKTLYDEAKEKDKEIIEKELIEKGKQEAYNKKREKVSISQTKGSSVITEDLIEELSKLSPEEYAKRKPEFDKYEAQLKGLI